ncbi:GxxExxY protein [Larkinella arboricola]
MEDSKLSYQIIRGAIEVHRALGPGLLESAYQECLHYELSEYGLYVEREKPMPIVYKEVRLNHGYRMDLLVEGRIVVETKTVEALTDVHFAQLLTYLKLGQFRLGLLINFHVTLLKEGVSRVLNPELRNSA